MAEVKWIKLTTGIFDDEKIKVIDSLPDRDAIFVIWIRLLTLAGKINDNGNIYISEDMPFTDEMLSAICNRPVTTIRLAIKTFEQFGMIKVNVKCINIVNWEKHQNITGLMQIRENNRLRQQKHRALLTQNVTRDVTDESQNVTLQNKNKNKNKIREDKKLYLDCIYLTDEQYFSLTASYGKTNTNNYIQKANDYIMSKGKRYKSHFHTIRNWMNKEKITCPQHERVVEKIKHEVSQEFLDAVNSVKSKS